MSDAIHAHNVRRIIYLVNDPIFADANPPIVIGTGQLSTARRTRILRQCLNGYDCSVVQLYGEVAKISFSSAFEEDAIHAYFPFRSVK